MENQVEVTKITVEPGFDLEGFFTLSHENRIGGATLERLETLWEEWSHKLSVYTLTVGAIRYLLVFLPKEVEEEVSRVWKAQASEGFLVNCLAQYMCMTTVQELLPEVEEGGCAPSPRPTAGLRKVLEELGVPYKSADSALLSNLYAVVTHYPYRGGCEICYMQEFCPKGQGKNEEGSVLLPGFERT